MVLRKDAKIEGPRGEDGGERTEGRGRKTDIRRRRTEDGRLIRNWGQTLFIVHHEGHEEGVCLPKLLQNGKVLGSTGQGCRVSKGRWQIGWGDICLGRLALLHYRNHISLLISGIMIRMQ